MKTLGNQIKEKRKAVHLSQASLAEQIGRSQCEVSRMESGKRDIKIDTLIDIARVLGVSAVDLDERLAA